MYKKGGVSKNLLDIFSYNFLYATLFLHDGKIISIFMEHN